MNPVLTSHATTDYRTPENVLALIREHDPIGLDPCASVGASVGAAVEWSTEGLQRLWIDHGLVFVNPPYGAEIASWAKKIAAEVTNGAEIIALVPARTETRWFQDVLVPAMAAICFWRGRLVFTSAQSTEAAHPAPFPSVLFYGGTRVLRFSRIFTRHGLIVRL